MFKARSRREPRYCADIRSRDRVTRRIGAPPRRAPAALLNRSAWGEIALRQGLFGDAIVHLQKAAKLAPRNTRVFTLLGDSHLALGRNNDAANFKKALQIDPDNQRARDGYQRGLQPRPAADR